MKFYTLENIGKEYEVLDTVKGSTVQTRNALRDTVAEIRSIFGGEIKEYTQMLNTAREIAEKQMIESAKELGADTVIGVRYVTNSLLDGVTELLVYGTAIKYK